MTQAYAQATRGQKTLKITGVRVIVTNPPYADGTLSTMQRLVIVKVETSEAGLYGLGCASFGFPPRRGDGLRGSQPQTLRYRQGSRSDRRSVSIR